MINLALTQGQFTTLSSEDSDLAQLKWCADKHKSGGFYAKRSDGRHRHVYLHRVVLERVLGRSLVKGEECDHIDLDKLNNRRENLRVATRLQNSHNKGLHSKNKSGYTGVYKISKRWSAYITVNRKRIHLGMHDTPEQAKNARDEATAKYYGDFARPASVAAQVDMFEEGHANAVSALHD